MAKRPSRLLNLNKPTTAQKKITATNAARSPLLRLPPEIRSRIFDFVLGGNVIHIRDRREFMDSHRFYGYQGDTKNKEHDYILTVCDSPESHDPSTPRLSLHILSSPDHLSHHEEDCILFAKRDTFSLDVLLVSRQAYQETILRPFTQAIFDKLTGDPSRFRGLYSFFRNLIPPQMKATTHMQMYCIDESRKAESTIRRLKGLEHLDILFSLDGGRDHMQALREFIDQNDTKAIVTSGLQSARVSVKITLELRDYSGAGLSAKSDLAAIKQ